MTNIEEYLTLSHFEYGVNCAYPWTNAVFAYRTICQDTVEEKVLELQNEKKELVSDLFASGNNLIRSLDQQDLEFPLS